MLLAILCAVSSMRRTQDKDFLLHCSTGVLKCVCVWLCEEESEGQGPAVRQGPWISLLIALLRLRFMTRHLRILQIFLGLSPPGLHCSPPSLSLFSSSLFEFLDGSYRLGPDNDEAEWGGVFDIGPLIHTNCLSLWAAGLQRTADVEFQSSFQAF